LLDTGSSSCALSRFVISCSLISGRISALRPTTLRPSMASLRTRPRPVVAPRTCRCQYFSNSPKPSECVGILSGSSARGMSETHCALALLHPSRLDLDVRRLSSVQSDVDHESRLANSRLFLGWIVLILLLSVNH